jgi:hypothetical protein
MRRNWHSLAQWQFLISCHRASEHDRDRLTEKLRGHIFGSRVLPPAASSYLINRPVSANALTPKDGCTLVPVGMAQCMVS